jgi:SAM-dependent methyltransferase
LLNTLIKAALKRAGYGVYNLAVYRVAPKDSLVVPQGKLLYDPNAEGVYDLKTKTVVSRVQAPHDQPFNLEREHEKLRAYVFRSPNKRLSKDRYANALAWLAPGSGLLLDACTPSPRDDVRERVRSLGYNYQAIDLNDSNPDVRKEDLTKLSFETGSVACVLSCDTLEHIEDFPTAMREIYRVLQEDGMAFIHVPCRWWDRPEGEPIKPGIDQFGHVYYHSARELLRLASDTGFVIVRAGLLLDPGAVLMALVKSKPLPI